MTNREKLNEFIMDSLTTFIEMDNENLVEYLQTEGIDFFLSVYLATYFPCNGYEGSLKDKASLVEWLNVDNEQNKLPSLIKPCPFCGGEVVISSMRGGLYWITCTKCKIEQGLPYTTLQEAIDAWNKRADDEQSENH